MILSDGEIEEAIRKKQIIIDPAPVDTQYTTSALDLMLGQEIFELKSTAELAAEEPPGVHREIEVNPSEVDIREMLRKYAKPLPKRPDGSFLLLSARFVLGITRERLDLPRESKIAARVEGRSTLARLGLVVHLTAPTIHSGFSGHIVLEMYNFGAYPLRLHPGKLAICQLIFERLGKQPKGPVRTAYMNQTSLLRKKKSR